MLLLAPLASVRSWLTRKRVGGGGPLADTCDRERLLPSPLPPFMSGSFFPNQIAVLPETRSQRVRRRAVFVLPS